MLQNLYLLIEELKYIIIFPVHSKKTKDFNAISENVKSKHRDNNWIYTHRLSLSEKGSNSLEINQQNWKTGKNEVEKPSHHKGNTQENKERLL